MNDSYLELQVFEGTECLTQHLDWLSSSVDWSVCVTWHWAQRLTSLQVKIKAAADQLINKQCQLSVNDNVQHSVSSLLRLLLSFNELVDAALLTVFLACGIFTCTAVQHQYFSQDGDSYWAEVSQLQSVSEGFTLLSAAVSAGLSPAAGSSVSCIRHTELLLRSSASVSHIKHNSAFTSLQSAAQSFYCLLH